MKRKGKIRKNKIFNFLIFNCNDIRACSIDSMYHILTESVKRILFLQAEDRAVCLNPLNAQLNPICNSQIAEFFCWVFKFCA